MRLFNRPSRRPASNKSVSGTSSARRPSAAMTMEPMEGRNLFSSSVGLPITPIPPKVPITPITPVSPGLIATLAINAEYSHTASETDAYGTNVQKLLGNATSGILDVSWSPGAKVKNFAGGSIYYSAGTGAHVVYGGIGAEYKATANEVDAYGTNVQKIIGLPTSDEMPLAGRPMARTNTFQGGAIDWSPSTGAHVVYGGIGGLWNSMGGANSWLGLAKSDEYGPQNNRCVLYEGGYITWSPSGGAIAHNTSVSINTRYGGKELVITENGPRDSVGLSQSGNNLTIAADGTNYTYAIPSGGIYVYSRGGTDSVVVGSNVTARTTLASIDNASTSVFSYGSHVTAWVDSSDSVFGTASTQRVSSFAGGVSKALGAHLANPSDTGATITVSNSLFGNGPTPGDINQGSVGDCYFMASLAGFANQRQSVLTNSAVDLGDGTYAVKFTRGGTNSFVRVSNVFSAGGFGGYKFAHPGASGSLWGEVMEKAYAYFRKGQNTYASLNSGWMSDVYSDLGVSSRQAKPSSFSSASLYSRLLGDLAAGEAVTFGTPASPPDLVGGHAYTLMGVQTLGGITKYIVRNPWGSHGGSAEDANGYAALTYAQLATNFTGMVEAT